MPERLPHELQHRLDDLVPELLEYPWFSTAGEAMRNGPRAANISEAHLGWWRPQRPDQAERKKEHWATATRALETRARRSLGDAVVEAVFRQVTEALSAPLRRAIGEYLDRVNRAGTAPDPLGEHAAAAVDAHQAILRDLGWAAVERLLGEEGFFSALLPWYRDGRWPCAWPGQPCVGRPVLL